MIPADDPRHGTPAGNSAGCICLPCRAARAERDQQITRLKAYGAWRPFVATQPVADHLRRLRRRYGINPATVAAILGMSESSVWAIYKAVWPNCRTGPAEKILALVGDLDLAPGGALIDPTGTSRRIQGIVADGYPIMHIVRNLAAHDTPVMERRIGRLAHCQQEEVTVRVARAVRAAAHRLTPRPHDDKWAMAARALAGKHGWMPLACWDDIDDPDARPTGALRPTGQPDPAAVATVLAGSCAQLRDPGDRRTAIHALWTAGVGDTAIARRIGGTPKSVAKVRRRAGWIRDGAEVAA